MTDKAHKVSADLEALMAELGEHLPEGLAFVAFLSVDTGDAFHTRVVANAPPQLFAPIVRAWLERYDAGEAMPFMIARLDS